MDFEPTRTFVVVSSNPTQALHGGGAQLTKLRAALVHAPTDLLSATCRNALEHIAQGLPPLTWTASYFECRLTPSNPQVDWLLQVSGHDGPSLSTEHAWLEDAIATSERSFWIELDDITKHTERAPAPGLHIRLDANYGRRVGLYGSHAPFDRDVALQKLSQLEGRHILDPSMCAAIKHCVTNLTAGARAIHVSAMNARVPAEGKLYVALPRNTVADYLAAIDWPGDRQAVLQRFERWDKLALQTPLVFCDLTFRPRLIASFAIVYSQWHVQEGLDDAARTKLRERLVASELLTPTQSAQLGSWVHAPNCPSPDSASRSQRWLDFKLRAQPSGEPELKVYLGAAIDSGA